MEAVKQVEYRDCTINIYPDDYPENPREWDNLSLMIMSHKRYSLGDNNHGLNLNDYDSWQEVEAVVKKKFKPVICKAVRGYDHSGFSISCSTGYPYNCPWDSGQVGFLIVTRETALKKYSITRITKKHRELIEKVALSELNTYNQYLTGEIYRFSVKSEDGQLIDSCGGYYGTDFEDMIKEGKSSIDYHLDEVSKGVEHGQLLLV